MNVCYELKGTLRKKSSEEREKVLLQFSNRPSEYESFKGEMKRARNDMSKSKKLVILTEDFSYLRF